jgi:hypothetical protein
MDRALLVGCGEQTGRRTGGNETHIPEKRLDIAAVSRIGTVGGGKQLYASLANKQIRNSPKYAVSFR